MFFKKKKIEDENSEIEVDILDENQETFLEKNNKKFKDLISCDYVDFSISPKMCEVGELYAKNMYIGILPSTVSFPTVYDELYNFGNVDTSIYISPIDNQDAIAALSKLRTNLQVEFATAVGDNRKDDIKAQELEAARLREEVREGFNRLYEVATISTLYCKSERELDNATVKLKRLLGRRDIGIKNAIYDQENAYMSNKPLMSNYLDEYHTFDKRSLACTYPFTSSNINHRKGIPIGYNKDNFLPVLYDPFDSRLNNYNMVIFAISGGGKSTFLKMLAARGATFSDIVNICLDVEREYVDISKTLGGINIEIKNDTDTIINFFHVESDFIKNKLTKKMEEVVLLNDKITSVTNVLLTLAKGTTGGNDKYYNDITKKIIRDSVKEVYENIGITNEVSSLYEENDVVFDEDGNISGGRTLKKMPTLSDWYISLENRAKNNKKDTYTEYYDYLLAVMENYTKYKNGGFNCFDGQSTVKLSTDISFINFDVSSLNSETELPLAQHIITDYIWETLIKKNENGKKIRMIIDEAWRMAKVINGKPKYPEALNFLESLFRTARKKNTAAVVISQAFSDFYNENTDCVVKNADTRVFLPPDKTSLADIQKVFHLTTGETAYLKSCKRGEALFKCGSESAKLAVDIPDFELEFVETNQNAKKRRGINEREDERLYVY